MSDVLQDDTWQKEAATAAVGAIEGKILELSVITSLSGLKGVAEGAVTLSDGQIELAQRGAALQGSIEKVELQRDGLSLRVQDSLGTNKEPYWRSLLDTSEARISNLKSSFTILNGSSDYTSAKSSFNLEFGGVIGLVAGAASIGYAIYEQEQAINELIDNAVQDGISVEDLFDRYTSEVIEVTAVTAGSVAAEFIIAEGAGAASGLAGMARFAMTAAKVTVASVAVTIAYNSGHALGTWLYDHDVVAESIQNAIDKVDSWLDDSTLERYPEAATALAVLVDSMGSEMTVDDLLAILSKSNPGFQDYGEVKAFLNVAAGIFNIVQSHEIQDSDSLIQQVVTMIIAIKESFPTSNFTFVDPLEMNLHTDDTDVMMANIFALENLNPFALVDSNKQSTLYDVHNMNGELNTENFSQQYLADRLDFLINKNIAYTNNSDEVSVTGVETRFRDDAFDIDIRQRDGEINLTTPRKVHFGDEKGNAIFGTSQDDHLYGRAGDDYIYADAGDDYLEGGSGADTLNGGADVDTYHFKLGDGQFNQINDYTQGNHLSFGSGISIDNFEYIEMDDVYDVDNGRLMVRYSENDAFIINDWEINPLIFDNLYYDRNDEPAAPITTPLYEHELPDTPNYEFTGTHGNDHHTYHSSYFYESDDPSTLNIDYVISGYGGDDVLSGRMVDGGSGDDILTSTYGIERFTNTPFTNSYLYGGAGNDTLTGGDGEDFLAGASGGLGISYAEYRAEYIAAYNEEREMHYKTSGTPLFDVENASDIGNINNMTGGKGNDFFLGTMGEDIYHFNKGDGFDIIMERSQGAKNILEFNYNVDDVSVWFDEQFHLFIYDDVRFENNPKPQTLFVDSLDGGGFNRYYEDGYYLNGIGVELDHAITGIDNPGMDQHTVGYGEFTYQFLDRALTFDELHHKALNYEGTELGNTVEMLGQYNGHKEKIINTYGGDDTVKIQGDNFTVTGGEGDDRFVIEASSGSNKFIFRAGDDNDTFHFDSGADSSGFQIFFANSISGESITIDDFFVEYHAAADRSLYGHLTLHYSLEDSIAFLDESFKELGFYLPDGSFHYLSEVKQVVYGSDGADDIELTSYNSDAIVNTGSGDDTVTDFAYGSTEYNFNLGDGNDQITEVAAHWDDSINFGLGIIEDDLHFERSDGDLIVHYSEVDSVNIKSWYGMSPSGHVEAITFSNDTTMSYQQILNIADGFPAESPEIIDVIESGNGTGMGGQLVGGDGDDILTGSVGDDFLDAGFSGFNTLEGGLGNDVLLGGIDTDGYFFSMGDGTDIIDDLGGDDYIEFSTDIDPLSVSFAREGSNLILSYSATDKISIENWYVGSEYQIENIYFADGSVWDSTYIQAATAIEDTSADDDSMDDAWVYDGTDDGIISDTGDDYLFSDQGTDGTIFLEEDGIDAISDSDGSTLDANYLSDQASLLPLPETIDDGDELTYFLVGDTGNDILTGLSDDDVTGLSDDSYVVVQDDAISESDGADTVQLDLTLAPEDLLIPMNGDDLLIEYGISDSVVSDEGSPALDDHGEQISFESRVVWDQITITNAIEPENV